MIAEDMVIESLSLFSSHIHYLKGTCIDGDCTCDVGYTGDDCSIYNFTMLSSAIVMNTATMLMLFFVIFCLLLTL